MKEFKNALSAQAVTTVNADNCADSVKSGSLPVFATPMLLALMEEATCKACAPLLDEGETTVGTSVSITHEKASAVGATITATAILQKVEGRRLVFSVTATDDNNNIIGKGEIERFTVLSEKFMKRVNGI